MRSVIAGNHMGHGVDPGDVIAGERLPGFVKVTIRSGRSDLWSVVRVVGKCSVITSRGACTRARGIE